MGLNDGNNHPPTNPQEAKDLIEWFKSGAAPQYRVTYMGGLPALANVDRRCRPDPA